MDDTYGYDNNCVSQARQQFAKQLTGDMYIQMVAKRTDTYIIQVYSQDSAEHMYVRNTNACIVFGQVYTYIYI